MDNKIIEHRPLNLLALTLCEGAKDQVELFRQKLWQKGGELLSLAISPLIPLKWSSESFPPFEHIKLPLMPQRITFNRFKVKEGVVYLKSEDLKYLEVVEKIEKAYPADNVLRYPFPPASGILLGQGEWSNGSLEIFNDDWRLLYLEVSWHSLKGRLTHLTHQITTNRHLLSINL